jgi:hypothetical protein
MAQIIFSELDNLLAALHDPSTEVQCWSSGNIEKPFSILSQDFIRFAEADLQSNLAHKNINALSNAKRALDCQIECLLATFGLLKVARKEHWGLPRKLTTIRALGLVAPGILEKINRLRNLLEHEFADPDIEVVKDALDTISIFVAYIEKVFENFRDVIELTLSDKNCRTSERTLVLKFNLDTKKLIIKRPSGDKPNIEDVMKIVKDIKDFGDLENLVSDSIALEPGDSKFLQFLERLINLR